jgi:acyl-CoA synthetase (AMP-forming)/AMP-acid ligase II
VLSSVGKVVKEVQVRIADDEDNALPTGDIGQVLIKSPTVFSGYWQRPDLNAAVLRGGWLHTGDLGYFDTEGWLNILGREADLLHRAGKTIYPRPVEEILHDHPAVKETTYVQVGDRAVMAVSLRQSWRGQQDEAHWVDEFTRFMGPRVNAAQAPDDYRVFEDLPRSLLGKVLRREVRGMLAAELG